MKTIVIIENEVVELNALVRLFEQWQKEINILTAREEKAAITIMSKEQVDLVICDLALLSGDNMADFSPLTHTFPYVPCIAISKEDDFLPEEAIKRGASHCLEKPLNRSNLLLHAGELLDSDTSGTVKGIPIHSFLQMLEGEQKTCTLQVDRNDDRGLLYVSKGNLIGAETKNFSGEAAVQVILSWQETVIRIRFFNGQRKRQIHKPLIAIIMESFRLNSERDKFNKESTNLKKMQLPLQHLSTLGKPIPLEIGALVKLEFPFQDTLCDSIMVGMLQDHCLIVTNPQPNLDFNELLGGEQRIIIRYLHQGRVWMFKSQVLKVIDAPSHLLFFEYPGAIHYHELRQAKRSPIFIPSTFHLNDKSELYGTLVDLSTTGGLYQLKHKDGTPLPKIEINSSIMLRCLLPGIKEEQQITGMVRNMQIDQGQTRIGIEFISLQPHLAETIGQYLFSIEGLGE